MKDENDQAAPADGQKAIDKWIITCEAEQELVARFRAQRPEAYAVWAASRLTVAILLENVERALTTDVVHEVVEHSAIIVSTFGDVALRAISARDLMRRFIEYDQPPIVLSPDTRRMP